MKIQKIDAIRKQFHNEWLLIKVEKIDPTTGTPLAGTIIDHSKSADEMWEKAEKHPEPVMVIYSDDWPEDVAACFITTR